jgi:uncharacterized membrane protein YdbT with pleckstrin-like domain
MDKPQSASEINSTMYQDFGKKAFYFIFYRHSTPASALFLIALVMFVASRFPAIRASSVGVSGIVHWVGIGSVILSVIFFIGAFITSWIWYKSNAFAVTEDALKVRRGIFSTKEIAIPYRQVQDISIERNLMQQMMGVSRLEILTAGEDHDADKDDEATLEPLDKDIAERLQSELIRRANVQKVIEQK